MLIGQRKRRRRIRQEDRKLTAWLRSCISTFDYGIRTKGPKPHPVHVNRKDTIIQAFNTKDWRLLKRLSNKDFGKHFTGQRTFYFAGNGRSRDPYTLALIDIDCHSTGTYTGAVSFVEYLRKDKYPGLFWERSTNGNGVHAYVVISKVGYSDLMVNTALDRLQAHLQPILASTSFDVEMVEVKGHCPVVGWAEKHGEIAKISMGQLGKLPIEGYHRPDELKKTAVLQCAELLRLPPPEQVSTNKKGQGQHKRPPASISGCFLSEDEVAKTHTSYLRLANLLLDDHCLRTSSKAKVNACDLSIFLMFLVFFTRNMNSDGSLPWARFKKFWEAVYKSGDINRPFQCNRFSAIRNYFSSLGLIEWTDETYKIGKLGKDGRKYGGRACKWKASQSLLGLIQKIEQSQNEEFIPEASAECGDGERASLTTTNIIKNLTRLTYSQTKRPRQVYDPPPLILLPEEISKYLTPIEDIHSIAL